MAGRFREGGLIQRRPGKGKEGPAAAPGQNRLVYQLPRPKYSTTQARPRMPQNQGEVASAASPAMPPMAAQENCRASAASKANASASGPRSSVALNRAAMPKMTARLPRIGGCQGLAAVVGVGASSSG